MLLGACTTCPLLKSDLEASVIEIKDLKCQIDHSSRYSILSPPCKMCGSLKGKLFHATKENTELKQEVAYLTSRLEKTKLSEKMIEDDLSRIEKSAIKSTYKLDVFHIPKFSFRNVNHFSHNKLKISKRIHLF
jgi:regulator of replication initiation timing